jgi:GNAT superfamily N-acetyltransferase
MKLLEARVDWLRSRHSSDQWGSVGLWQEKVARNLYAGATRVLCLDGMHDKIVGTITVSRAGDPQFWETSPGSALYLAKLATDPEMSGLGLGSLLLDWAVDYAHRNGLPQVRLDAWKDSVGLHQYYRARGWTFHGTVDDPTRRSGALFSRPSAIVDFSERLLPITHRREEIVRTGSVELVSDDAMEPPTQVFANIRDEEMLSERHGPGDGPLNRFRSRSSDYSRADHRIRRERRLTSVKTRVLGSQ